MRVDITLLGGFDVRVDDKAVDPLAWERRQASALVKLLALTPGRQLHREQCIDAIWPDVDIADAAPRLHKAAHYARKALGDRDAIVLRRDAVALFPSAEVTVDVDVFEALAARALDRDESQAVGAALDRYGGVLLPTDPYEEWTSARREHARLRYRELLRRAGRWEALLVEDPADEHAHLALMRAHVDSGDRRSALRQYERMDRALREELGMIPSAAATRLRDEIIETMPEPAVVSPTVGGLVGREREFGVLADLLAQTGDGRGRAVLVSGPPGVGKSTLVERLRARAGDTGWRCGTGIAAAIEGAWPYAPVLEAIADLGRRHPTLLDGLDDRYRAEIDRARRGGEPERYEPAEELQTGTSPSTGRAAARPAGHQRLFVAVAELVRLAASGAGVLLIIEDAHEADDASLRLLHYLARVATEERVLLVVTRRSNVDAAPLEDMRASLQRRAALLELDVPPLDLEATRQLVRRYREDADDEFVQRVWAVSGGIPFAIGEYVQRGDARLDASLVGGIDERTRDVLQRVAIAGMVFDTDGFVALSGLDDEAAFTCLDAALSGRVIERAESGYRFRHALVRDALLADLPPHRQRVVHRDAAKRLEAINASPARIGYHLLEAGDPAAIPYLMRVAQAEAALGAYRDALTLVDAARPHANRDDMAGLSALRGDLLFALGDPTALSAYRDAYELTQPADAKRLVQAKLARVALFSGDSNLAGAMLRGLEPNGDMADTTIILAKANHAYFSGDIETASTLANRARELVDVDRENWQLLDLVALQGLIAHNQGEWFDQLRLELRRTRDTPRLANAVFDGHLCVAEYLLYGPVPYAEVLELAGALRATGARAGALRAVAFAAALAGEAALLAGDLERAERELQEAVDLHREIGAAAGEAHSLQRFAELELARGNRDAARAFLERALPLARWSTIALHLLQRIYGTMIAAASTPQEARAVVDAAGAALGTDDFCPFCQVMYEVPAAIACADAGDLDAANDHYAVAEQSAQLWHGTAWQGAMLEVRAHIATAAGDAALAADLFDQAAAAFERAGQPLDAARCRAAVAVPHPA